MISIRACFAAVPVCLVIVACGGSSSDTGAIPDGDSGTTDATASNDSAGNSDTASGGDSSVNDASVGPDTAFLGDSALTLDGNDGGGCPNTIGGYSLLVATGLGCGDLDTTAKQCILYAGGGGNACLIHFQSEQPMPGRAINGPSTGADVQSDGTFDNAALREGTVQRTGCTGSFNPATQTMTVNCGGTGSSQSCTVTMVRSSVTCP